MQKYTPLYRTIQIKLLKINILDSGCKQCITNVTRNSSYRVPGDNYLIRTQETTFTSHIHILAKFLMNSYILVQKSDEQLNKDSV